VGHDYGLVALLGTNHTTPPFAGMAVFTGGGFETPLGVVRNDRPAAAELLAADPACVDDPRPHWEEHSIEVQLPFVQHLFPGTKILPAIVGSPDAKLCARFGRALAKVIEKRAALVVASCDLSHYPSQDAAAVTDAKVLEAMVTLDPEKFRNAIEAQERRGIPRLSTCACGEAPVLSALTCASALGAKRGTIVSYANSGDTLIGESDRVVGYGAVALYAGAGDSDTAALARQARPPEPLELRPEDKKALLAFARETLRRFLTTDTLPMPRGLDPRLNAERGAFVTLKKKGELRGCIGHMVADSPLVKVVGSMALQAGLNDRRFTPLREDELAEVELEISVLTPARSVSGPEEIVLGRDGVILSKDGSSAVFLPQVATEQGWSRDEMLDHLARKAGLPAGSWREGAKFSTFQAEVFHESALR
jgi:hypothetical protein